jgi:phosphatidylinositol alpha-mannosyltransferase
VVIGAFDQEQMQEYRDFVDDAGLTDVVFKGFVSDEEKIRYYQNCDVFCSPAIGRESQGVILLEAMAAGKPVLASAIDGYRTVVRHEQDGLLVPPADEAALAVGLCRLLADEPFRRRLAIAGHTKVQAYSWRKVSRQILELYQEAMEAERRAGGRQSLPALPLTSVAPMARPA